MKLRWEHHGACWLLRHENGWTEALAAKDHPRHHGWVAVTTSAGSHAVKEISRSTFRDLKIAVLPKITMWAEIKPSWFSTIEEDKAVLLAKLTRKHVLLLDGCPNYQSYFAITCDAGETTFADYSLDIWQRPSAYFEESRLWAQPHYRLDDLEGQFSERYRTSVEAARAERFAS